MPTTWRTVDTGGKVTITKWRDTSGTETVLDLLDGTGIEECSLAVRPQTATIKTQGGGTQRKVVQRDWRITGTRALEDADLLEVGEAAHSVFALMAPAVAAVYAIYKNANGTREFEGWCVAEEGGDDQRAADYERQSFSLVNDGDVVYPV